MKRFVPFILITIMFSFNSASADVLFDRGNLKTTSGKYSSLMGQQIADDFSIAFDASISKISWWGWYDFDESMTDYFRIRFYSDNLGLPGSLLTNYTIGSSVSRTATGDIGGDGAHNIYKYELTLSSSFYVSANTTYWISIMNGDYTNWGWLASDVLGAHAYRPSGDESSWNLNSGHHSAFILEGDVPPVPEPVFIDIKPGSFLNSINPKSKGKIPVAILSTKDFNAPKMVDRDSLTFGATGDEDSLAFCNPKGEYINGDRLKDLVCHFYTEDTEFLCGDTEGVLKGMTTDGIPIEGRDSVKIVPCKK